MKEAAQQIPRADAESDRIGRQVECWVCGGEKELAS